MHNAHERHSALHGAAETEQAVETTDNRKSCNCSGDSGDFFNIHIIINSIKNQDQFSDGRRFKKSTVQKENWPVVEIILERERIYGGMYIVQYSCKESRKREHGKMLSKNV